MKGMNWLADDPKRPMEMELKAAMNYMQEKYGCKPIVIMAHSSVETCRVDKVQVRPSSKVSYPNQYLLAWEA